MSKNKSAMKRLKTSSKDNLRHKTRKSALATYEKNYRDAIESGDVDASTKLLTILFSNFDKALKVNTVTRNRVNRKKSNLAKLLANLKKTS